ncbi:hypothetical protein ACVI1L_001524 [Bradyrhizobium sp. USDA 4516]
MNGLTANSAGSTKGFLDLRQCHAKAASETVATAKPSTTPRELHPQSFAFTIANVSAPIPEVTSSAAHELGRGTS